MIITSDDSITLRADDEMLVIKAWGENSVRVRDFVDQREHNKSCYHPELNVQPPSGAKVVKINENAAKLINGELTVILDHRNRLTFYKNGQVLLREFVRLRAVKHDDGSENAGSVEVTNDFNSTLKLKPRVFKPHLYGGFNVIQRFESNSNEHIFGMGQYQQPFLDQKYNVLELAQRNSQVSIPFYISSLGYGFLWNNPGIGKVEFAKNLTQWTMDSSYEIDYWVTVGDTPKQITEQYTSLVGRSPIMPSNLLGLWQSKLRYRTENEVLEIARNYRRRGIKPSVIAIDYFHWPAQGEYQFDEKYWPHVTHMVKTLQDEYQIEPIVSIWPTVQDSAKNYNHYFEDGYLVKVNSGVRTTMKIQGNTVFIDMTNPEARNYVWSLIEKNYVNKGIKRFWLDVAEPGYSIYDFENYRYYAGSDLEVGNIYPNDYLKMVYQGLKTVDGGKPVVTLVRGSWIGAQKYGALLWSGDIDSSFRALRNQVNTGLNVGIAGLPWWTTDIGGFHGGHPEQRLFRQLLIRWFEYSTFSPILRMHGDRQPHSAPLSNTGGGAMVTGAPNEIWSYGPEVEKVLIKYLQVRELLRPYLEILMKEAHYRGFPIMRTLFYEFPHDQKAWGIDNTYMLGEGILVAPILYQDEYSRRVYLPGSVDWINPYTNEVISGGQWVEVTADLDEIPVFINASYSFDFSKLIKALRKRVI